MSCPPQSDGTETTNVSNSFSACSRVVGIGFLEQSGKIPGSCRVDLLDVCNYFRLCHVHTLMMATMMETPLEVAIDRQSCLSSLGW